MNMGRKKKEQRERRKGGREGEGERKTREEKGQCLALPQGSINSPFKNSYFLKILKNNKYI